MISEARTRATSRAIYPSRCLPLLKIAMAFGSAGLLSSPLQHEVSTEIKLSHCGGAASVSNSSQGCLPMSMAMGEQVKSSLRCHESCATIWKSAGCRLANC